MIKKAWMCNKCKGVFCVEPYKGCILCPSRIEPILTPVTIVPTPYFNALRDAAESHKELLEVLSKCRNRTDFDLIVSIKRSWVVQHKLEKEEKK